MYAILNRTKADENLFDEEENKCPPQHVPRANPNETRASHNPEEQVSIDYSHEPRMNLDEDKKEATVQKHKHQHMDKHKHRTQHSMESSQRHKEHRDIVQIDKAVAMEEGVFFKEKINWEYPPGHVPLSHPNELWASNENRNTVQDMDIKYPGTSGSQRVVSASRGPDAGPGAEVLGSQPHHPNATEGRRRRTQERIFPGAFREGGIDNEEGYEEDERTIESRTELIPPTLSAELVNAAEEEKRVQDKIDQALQRQLQKAAVAEVVSHRGRRRWGALLLLILIVIGVVLGITLRPDAAVSTLAPTSAPTPAPTLSSGDLSYLLGSVSSDDGEALRSPSTPQNMAFKWLANNTNLGTYTNETIIQRYALATLYYSTNGDSWVNNALWLDDGDECGSSLWFNVECTSNRSVESLKLSSNHLSGMIPPEIGLLPDSLALLGLNGNSLQGMIPTEIGLLSNSLGDIDLGFNQLSGTIPNEVGQLKQLTSLLLGYNKLEGPIPSEIGALTNLTTLVLESNTITGTIPTIINSLPRLQMLFLGDNFLTGNYTCSDTITLCFLSCSLSDFVDPTNMSYSDAINDLFNANPACRSL